MDDYLSSFGASSPSDSTAKSSSHRNGRRSKNNEAAATTTTTKKKKATRAKYDYTSSPKNNGSQLASRDSSPIVSRRNGEEKDERLSNLLMLESMPIQQIILEAEMASARMARETLSLLDDGDDNDDDDDEDHHNHKAYDNHQSNDIVSKRYGSSVPNRAQSPRLRSTAEVLKLATRALRSPVSIDQNETNNNNNEKSTQQNPSRCLSPAESDVGSIDDFETAVDRLPTRLDNLPTDKLLQRVDGIVTSPHVSPLSSPVTHTITSTNKRCEYEVELDHEDENSVAAIKQVPVVCNNNKSKLEEGPPPLPDLSHKPPTPPKEKSQVSHVPQAPYSPFDFLSYFWGGSSGAFNDSDENSSTVPLSCGPSRLYLENGLPAMATSIVRVKSEQLPPSYVESIDDRSVDPRMPDWIKNQYRTQPNIPEDGTYHLGASKTVIVHEVQRGNWTWCTAWSPDGTRLAVGTQLHNFCVIDTNSSSVWRVRYDGLIHGPSKNNTTHTIRSIAWGSHFIAVGGTGNAVSILAPIDPYPVLHRITGTGFVSSLDWLSGTTTLVIGSRVGKAQVVRIWAKDGENSGPRETAKEIQSTLLHTIQREKYWIDAVKFSPVSMYLAAGDSGGVLGVYSLEQKPRQPSKIKNIANFQLENSIMDVEWSPDAQWLYAGGEDYAITMINTTYWEAVHRVTRDRWVQFISSSFGGTHLAVGGYNSEVSILEVDEGWSTSLSVSLKGLVPLSAQWHPKDQYLVMTGQDNSILAIETTSARYVTGHFLRSVSPILAIAFSPDGRMAVVGNKAGIVSIFKLSGNTFVTVYELVVDCDGTLSIQWSLNGSFIAIASGKKLILVARAIPGTLSRTAPPNVSGFSVSHVITDGEDVNCVAIDPQSRFLAVSGGATTKILDASANFKYIREYENEGTTMEVSWSPDGEWLATIGNEKIKVFDVSENHSKWVFEVPFVQTGRAVAWGPLVKGGLQYIAFGGEDKHITIMEIRTKKPTWELVLKIPRDDCIYDLDWNSEGLVAAAIGNGTVTILDLSYLQSGFAVSDFDYNWQRQALTCFTEIRQNRGKNCIRTVRWIPSAPGSDSLLALGGTDGQLEIIDLTARERCSGFYKVGT